MGGWVGCMEIGINISSSSSLPLRFFPFIAAASCGDTSLSNFVIS